MSAVAVPLVDVAEITASVNALADMEAAIVRRLAAALTPAGKAHPVVDVQSWPDDPKSYRLSHPVGAALVIYQGFAATPPDGGMQVVTHTFGVRVMARTLRDPNTATAEARAGSGTYQLLQVCNLALNGYVPQAGCDAMQVRRAAFEDYVEGVWHYELTATTQAAQLVPPECVPGPWIYEGPGVCCEQAPPTTRVDFATPADVSPNPFISPQPETMP